MTMLTVRTAADEPVEVEPLARRDGLAAHPELHEGEPAGPATTITHEYSGLAVLTVGWLSPEDAETLLWLLSRLWDWERSAEELKADPDFATVRRAGQLLADRL